MIGAPEAAATNLGPTEASEASSRSVHLRLDSLRKEKLSIKNEWRKEKKNADYDSDEDGELYRSSIKKIEDVISVAKDYLTKVSKA